MNDRKAQSHQNGFVWGLILGGGLMYLISTPNGRRILKEISEGGIEKLADYIDLEKLDEIKETIGNNFEFNESDFEGIEQDAKQDMEATKKRRFFKGIRRR